MNWGLLLILLAVLLLALLVFLAGGVGSAEGVDLRRGSWGRSKAVVRGVLEELMHCFGGLGFLQSGS